MTTLTVSRADVHTIAADCLGVPLDTTAEITLLVSAITAAVAAITALIKVLPLNRKVDEVRATVNGTHTDQMARMAQLETTLTINKVAIPTDPAVPVNPVE